MIKVVKQPTKNVDKKEIVFIQIVIINTLILFASMDQTVLQNIVKIDIHKGEVQVMLVKMDQVALTCNVILHIQTIFVPLENHVQVSIVI